MKIKSICIFSLMLLSGCHNSLVPPIISSSLVNENTSSIISSFTNINSSSTSLFNDNSSSESITSSFISTSQIKITEYTLTFKYTELINNKLEEVKETEEYTFNYIYEENHIITNEDYDQISKDIFFNIPGNEGGYYVFDGFYSDLSMNEKIEFGVGFKVDNNYLFYYTYSGGPATPPDPTGTYKLNIEDPNNYIYDKPIENESYFAPGDIIKLHAYPIMDADLAMYLNGEFYSIQTCIEINEEYIWEYTFNMPNEETTISFVVDGGL